MVKAQLDSLVSFLRRSKKTIFLILFVATATMLATTAISIWLSKFHNLNFPSIGTLYTIGVRAYRDANLENETTEINWDTIYVGTSKNVTLYVQSVSNVKTTLKLSTANWTFLNSVNAIVSGPNDTIPYIHLTWDYDDLPVNPQETIQVTLTLTTDDSLAFIQFLINNNINQFSFDIKIRANQE